MKKILVTKNEEAVLVDNIEKFFWSYHADDENPRVYIDCRTSTKDRIDLYCVNIKPGTIPEQVFSVFISLLIEEKCCHNSDRLDPYYLQNKVNKIFLTEY